MFQFSHKIYSHCDVAFSKQPTYFSSWNSTKHVSILSLRQILDHTMLIHSYLLLSACTWFPGCIIMSSLRAISVDR